MRYFWLSLLSFGLLLFSVADSMAAKRILKDVAICGGDAEYQEHSQGMRFKECASGSMQAAGCVDVNIYQYSVICNDGSRHDGPEVFFVAQGRPSGLSVQNNTLNLFLVDQVVFVPQQQCDQQQNLDGTAGDMVCSTVQERRTEPVWKAMPRGYAPLQKNARIVVVSDPVPQQQQPAVTRPVLPQASDTLQTAFTSPTIPGAESWLVRGLIAGIAGLALGFIRKIDSIPVRIAGVLGASVAVSWLTFVSGGAPSLAVPLAAVGGLALSLVVSMDA